MSIALIKNKLESEFPGAQIALKNTTSMHQRHCSSDLHLKTKIIYDGFKEVPLIKRHRMIHEVLREEMNSIIHALSMEDTYES